MIHKLVTRVIQHFCVPDRPMKGGDWISWISRKGRAGGGGDLRKGEV